MGLQLFINNCLYNIKDNLGDNLIYKKTQNVKDANNRATKFSW